MLKSDAVFEIKNTNTQIWLHGCLGDLAFSVLKSLFPSLFHKLAVKSFHREILERPKDKAVGSRWIIHSEISV